MEYYVIERLRSFRTTYTYKWVEQHFNEDSCTRLEFKDEREQALDFFSTLLTKAIKNGWDVADISTEVFDLTYPENWDVSRAVIERELTTMIGNLAELFEIAKAKIPVQYFAYANLDANDAVWFCFKEPREKADDEH